MKTVGSLRVSLVLAGVALLLGVLSVKLWRRQWLAAPPPAPTTHEFLTMGTFARVQLYAPPDQAGPVARRIEERVQRLSAVINRFDPASELSELNRTAAERPFACSAELWGILQAARQAYAETAGAFDITVGPLMRLWGFHRQRQSLPTAAEIAAAREVVGLDKVRFDDAARTVRFTRPGMELDCGGIAKGYALDLARDLALAAGLRQGLIDFGGNLLCLPEPPPGRAGYRIGVRHPFAPQELLTLVTVVDGCVATSGGYESNVTLAGRKVGHIMDPRTGQPVSVGQAVTVLCRRGVDSDVFSTALFVAGRSPLPALWARDPAARALFCTPAPSGGVTQNWLPAAPAP